MKHPKVEGEHREDEADEPNPEPDVGFDHVRGKLPRRRIGRGYWGEAEPPERWVPFGLDRISVVERVVSSRAENSSHRDRGDVPVRQAFSGRMMRLWRNSYARPVSTSNAGVVSVVAHAVVIALWVLATLPEASLPSDSFANRVYYMPPPNKPMVPREMHEAVRYLTLTPGLGMGPGPADINGRRPSTPAALSSTAGGERVDSVAPKPPPVIGDPAGDSVFTELDVDSAVVRSQSSAAPAYPLVLLSKRIEGGVIARYIVDTTGFADTTSIEIVSATNPEFVRSVRDALPYMRFSPAKIGTHKVRQLVEQGFTFRITPAIAGGAKP
jgi:Gram-negative bacterial TonB protein C-terminal